MESLLSPSLPHVWSMKSPLDAPCARHLQQMRLSWLEAIVSRRNHVQRKLTSDARSHLEVAESEDGQGGGA